MLVVDFENKGRSGLHQNVGQIQKIIDYILVST